MTDRQLRDIPRINYQVLATTGETVHIDLVPQDPVPAEGLSDDNSGSGSEGSLDRTLIAEANEENEDLTLNHVGVPEPQQEVALQDQVPRISIQDSSDESSCSSGDANEPCESLSETNTIQRTLTESDIDRISQNLANISLSEMDLIKLQSLEETIHYDILDYVDENPVDMLLAIDDINDCVSKMEDFRSKFRNVHADLRRLDRDEYKDKYEDRYDKVMKVIKMHISSAREIKNEIRNREVQASAELLVQNRTRRKQKPEVKPTERHLLLISCFQR